MAGAREVVLLEEGCNVDECVRATVVRGIAW
jgi:hypothetical protein